MFGELDVPLVLNAILNVCLVTNVKDEQVKGIV